MKNLIKGGVAALLLAGVSMPATAQVTNTATASATADVITPVTVTEQSNLNFGVVVIPYTGSGTVEIATGGAVTYTGIVHAAGSTSVADFQIQGDGGQTLNVVLTSPTTLVSGSNTIPYTVGSDETNIGSSISLGGTLYTTATIQALVGGKITLSSTTIPGTYTGTLSLTANYN